MRVTYLTDEMIADAERKEMRAYKTISAIKGAIKMYEEYTNFLSKKFEKANEKCRTEHEYYIAVMTGNVDLANEIANEREEAVKWLDLYNDDFRYLQLLYTELERRKKWFRDIKKAAACIVATILPIFN